MLRYLKLHTKMYYCSYIIHLFVTVLVLSGEIKDSLWSYKSSIFHKQPWI